MLNPKNRKKTMKTMKTFRLFSMAALALVMAACSNDLNELETVQPSEARTMHFSATIAAPGSGATTRTTYTNNITSISVAWKSGDKIALVHGGKKDVVTVGTPNGDGSATISGTITVGTDGEDIVLVYPADLVASATSGTTYTESADVTEKFKSQDGTLNYIQDNLDIRKGSGKLAVSGGSASLKDNVKMNSQIAIWSIKPMNGNWTIMGCNGVTVKVGGNTVASASASSGFSSDNVYLALAPASMGTGALRIEASSRYGDNYYYEKSDGVSLTAGNFYDFPVRMQRSE